MKPCSRPQLAGNSGCIPNALHTRLCPSGADACSANRSSRCASSSEVQRLLKDASGNFLSDTVGVTFSVYSEQTGGVALWQETHNVQFAQGATQCFSGRARAEGFRAELFTADSAVGWSYGSVDWRGRAAEGAIGQRAVLR